MISNRPIEDWPKTLGDAATTSALLDRLMHHAHMLSFQGKSYRLEENWKCRQEENALAKNKKES